MQSQWRHSSMLPILRSSQWRTGTVKRTKIDSYGVSAAGLYSKLADLIEALRTTANRAKWGKKASCMHDKRATSEMYIHITRMTLKLHRETTLFDHIPTHVCIQGDQFCRVGRVRQEQDAGVLPAQDREMTYLEMACLVADDAS